MRSVHKWIGKTSLIRQCGGFNYANDQLAAAREQEAFFKLKQAIHYKFVQRVCWLTRIMFLHEAHIVGFWCARLKADAPFFSLSEVSWVSGREEAMRVPPSETVTHQRPDHRLWPSTGTLLATGLCTQQGVIWLDQKTPNRPKDCPAGSWSRWDTIHFTAPSVNGIEERGYFS